ncbi:MAG: hypothetical protein ISN29_09655 [Gammaproteobacteria bacterium AqS3]|nr:hypothetical protein [Gammaproteobacteria bacterium AqS3]
MNLDPEKVAIFIITFTLLLACIHAAASEPMSVPPYYTTPTYSPDPDLHKPGSVSLTTKSDGVCWCCPKSIPNTPKYISYMGWLSIPFGEKPKLTFMVTNKI